MQEKTDTIRIENRIYLSFVAFLIFGMLLFAGGTVFGIGNVSRKTVFEALGVFSVFTLFLCLKATGKTIISTITAVVIGLCIWVYGIRQIYRVISEYFSWLLYGRGSDYTEIFSFFQVVFIGLVSFFLSYIYGKHIYVKAAFGIVTVLITVVLIFREAKIGKGGVSFLFSFILLGVVEIIEYLWKKNKAPGRRNGYIFFLWPFFVLYLLVMLASPVSDKPYDWGFARELIDNISDKFTTWLEHRGGGREDFGIAMAGFSGDGELKDTSADNNTVYLELNSAMKPYTNMYIGGLILEDFNGHEWTNSKERTLSYELMDKMDTLETYCAVSETGLDIKRYLRPIDVEVTYKSLHSKYYFKPSKVFDFKANHLNLLEDSDDSIKQLKKMKAYSDIYSFSYYQLNLGENVFAEILDAPNEIDESLFYNTGRLIFSEDIDAARLTDYRSEIYRLYCEDIQLSDEVKDWIADNTTENVSPYYNLRELENALSAMSYTYTPGEIPDWVEGAADYLDYFLLQKKSGYCTHYATAMVLLARSMGMPARIVQGYCVPTKNVNEALVTGNMAHAWCEVYFDNVGWIPFEATPGYIEKRYSSWHVVPISELNGGKPQLTYPEFGKHDDTEDIPAGSEIVVESDEKHNTIPFDLIGLGVGITLLILTFFFAINVVLKRYIYKKKNTSDKYKWQISRLFIVLSKYDLARDEYETITEFGERVCDRFDKQSEGLHLLFETYENFLYGSFETDDTEIEKVIVERESLVSGLKGYGRFMEKIVSIYYR